jgi:hypothetical protein
MAKLIQYDKPKGNVVKPGEPITPKKKKPAA